MSAKVKNSIGICVLRYAHALSSLTQCNLEEHIEQVYKLVLLAERMAQKQKKHRFLDAFCKL